MSNNTSQNTAVVSSNDIYTYKELSIDKLKHEYEITVSGEHIKQKVDSELQKIAQTAKLPGFRVGKTPYELIIKNYKNTALESTLNDVLDYCSGDLMQKIKIESHIYPKIDVVSLPNLDAEDEKSSLVYKLSFESMPEVPVIDLDKINLKKLEVKVEEDDIKEYIDSIKVKFPNFVSVDDASYQAKSGDNLTIDFEGRIRGKLFKGGSSKNFSAKLGSNKFIGGFEDQLIGMKKGETKNFELQFPENYQQFAGQKVDFFVQVNDIQVVKEFANDDDMAKNIGFEDYSSLVSHAKQVISDQCDKMTDLLMKKQLFDCLDVDYNFDIPTNVVYQEQQRIKGEMDDQDNSYEEAEKRVKLAMLFMKFSTEHKISLDSEDIFNVILKQYASGDISLSKAMNYYKLDRQFQELVRGQALESKVTNYMMEKINKEQQTVSVKELKELFDNI